MAKVVFVARPAGNVERPPGRWLQVQCGVWWFAAARSLWVDALTYVGRKGLNAVEACGVLCGVGPSVAAEAIGHAAAVDFQAAFPGAVPGTLELLVYVFIPA